MVLGLIFLKYISDCFDKRYQELVDEMLRKNRTIDWNRREAERANMRRLVRRLLRKYKYPPKEAEGAMEIVISQCEQWAENHDDDAPYIDLSATNPFIKKATPYFIDNDSATAIAAEPN